MPELRDEQSYVRNIALSDPSCREEARPQGSSRSLKRMKAHRLA